MKNQTGVEKLTKNEILMLNIGSMGTGATVAAVKKNVVTLQLTRAVCTNNGDKVTISRSSGIL